MKWRDWIWPAIGILAIIFSGWLLYKELSHISLEDIIDSLHRIPTRQWVLAGLASLAAYTVLAMYDGIALAHLNRKLPWRFIFLSSFTCYAISHNIGASVFSGAVVRYRAYSTQGLSTGEVGILVALCSFTFALGVLLLGGIVCIVNPDLILRFFDVPSWVSRAAGFGMLAIVALYAFGSWRGLKPLQIGRLRIFYPRLPIVGRQLVIAPLELMAAAAVLYFALPAEGNPGYFVVLGIFLVSFSAALLSHAPGGLGVMELVFVAAMPDLGVEDVMAALIVFRLLYLIVPFTISLLVVFLFERSQIVRKAALGRDNVQPKM